MPSTFTTDPIGPRSVDEMLDVVYGRAAVLHRRRTMQRVGGAIAAVVVAAVATLTLHGGDEGAQVRVVGDPKHEQHEDGAAPTTGGDSGKDAAGQAAAPAPSGPRPRTSAPKAPKAGADTTVPSVVAPPAPAVETWKAISDSSGDATPPDWYYDITEAAMSYDPSSRTVSFTTGYRSGQPSDGRQSRRLESDFSYDGRQYAVWVDEVGDTLGDVRIDVDENVCQGCTARFDSVAARLAVTVPVSELNEEIARHADSPPLGAGAGARIDGLVATTATLSGGTPTIEADTAGQAS